MFPCRSGYVNDIKDTTQENVSTTELQALVGYIEDALSPAPDMWPSRVVIMEPATRRMEEVASFR